MFQLWACLGFSGFRAFDLQASGVKLLRDVDPGLRTPFLYVKP